MKTIKVIVEVDVPDAASDEEITQWVDVHYGECNGMNPENPCAKSYDVFQAEWESK